MTTLMLAALLLAAAPTTKLDPESQTLLNMRVSGAVLASHYERRPMALDSQPRFLTLESLGSELEPEERRLLATRDGWGRPLRAVVGMQRSFALISFGADGKGDVDYEAGLRGELAFEAARASSPEPAPVDRDIVFVDTDFVQRPERTLDLAERAVMELRSIGTAVEAFAVDSNVYPGPTSGLQTIDAIARSLEPVYIQTVPRLDPWGRPYLIWSDGKSYVLVSAGEDGVVHQSYAGGSVGPTGDDLCFQDGRFVDGR